MVNMDTLHWYTPGGLEVPIPEVTKRKMLGQVIDDLFQDTGLDFKSYLELTRFEKQSFVNLAFLILADELERAQHYRAQHYKRRYNKFNDEFTDPIERAVNDYLISILY